MIKQLLICIGSALIGATLVGVLTPKTPDVVQQDIQTAIAHLQPMNQSGVRGVFLFSQDAEGVYVSGHITGLTPNSEHGVHIHQFGDLSDAKQGKSAGGHYNPAGHPHGLPPSPIRHAGAFGNIQADEHGTAIFNIMDPTISLTAAHPILGRSVVVHANKDTGEQPAGNAGPRIAVGVIGIAKQ